ncbi:outer membrane protein assembly factor BamB [Aquabacterium sp.]|uniref:outer membrane protein assembly factor BamB n=1 Tax=Aquabacterium sp. TaxID=1872578 RepID=UPI0035B4E301
MMRRLTVTATLSSMLACLVACSFTDKPAPTPLQALADSATAQPLWSVRLGGDVSPALRMTVADGLIVAVNDSGDVSARELLTGRERWHGRVDGIVSAGVGSDGRYAAVVTKDNELVVLDSGMQKWRTPLNTRVVTSPLVAGERVFVQGVDRAVAAFDVIDGRKLWVYQRPSDPLALSQPGVLQPVRNTLWIGVGPRLVALDPVRGTVKQDAIVASPRGGNEVERLADLVGPAARFGDVLCVRSFQTAVGCLDATQSVVTWSKTQAGMQGLAMDDEFVYGADSSDRVVAWRRTSGDIAWRVETLLHRTLSAPAAIAGKVAVGDFEGYVHLLSRQDGHTVARLSTRGSGVASPMVVVGSNLLVLTRDGGLFAFAVD